MNPFRPNGDATVNIDVSSSSQRVKVSSFFGPHQIRVTNLGTAAVWLKFGSDTVTADVTNDFPVGAGSTEVFTVLGGESDLYVAAIAAASTGKIYFTPGEGV